MPSISVNLAEVHEQKPVPPGTYDLTIAEAEYRDEKHDIRVSIGIDDHLDAPNITHFISLPKEEDDDRKAAFKSLMLKRFLVAFNIDFSDDEIDTDAFAGAQANLEVGLSEPNEQGNVYNRIRLPYLPDEERPAAKSSAKGKAAARPPKR